MSDSPVRAVARWSLAGALAVGLAVAAFLSGRATAGRADAARRDAPPPIYFNEAFIRGLYAGVDVDVPDSVFAFVFANLPDRATVYPTENYYYFTFTSRGRTWGGNLRLDASDRDRGVIHLGYFEYDERGKLQDREGRVKAFGARDAVRVRRRAPLWYDVAFRGRTVAFHLYDYGAAAPARVPLRDGERFVGPVFDESGLRFHLVFDTRERHFAFVLKDDGFVPETFDRLPNGVLVGRRTGFAFYDDSARHRRVLVAVHGRNSERNNYYDGPFDQLPDNFVARSGIRPFMEAAYPYTRGIIDRFGGFTNQPGARTLLSPYYDYYDEAELGFVESCRRSRLSDAAFNACITPDAYQIWAPVRDRPE